MQQSTVLFTIPLDQQLLQANMILDKAVELLKAQPHPLPSDAEKLLRDVRSKVEKLSAQVKKTEEEREDLLALADISQIVNSSLDLNTVLQIVMDTIIRITGAERCFLMLRDDDGELQMRMARNWERVHQKRTTRVSSDSCSSRDCSRATSMSRSLSAS